MATQTFQCVLCQVNFASVEEFNSHEKQELHRREFERRMDGTSVGMLLCKCCFISVPTLKDWEDHVKSNGHMKLVGQSEFLGKRCVWQVPGVKMKDGSIKLCKDIKQLFDSGWKDPDYVQKVTTQGLLETDMIIGMNCITLKSMVNDLPMYHCSLCCVDFHHNDRNHVIGRHHRINVVWNWEKKTADRIAKGLEFPKASTRAKAQAELEEVTRKIFKMEQDCLNDDQFDLYQVMATKKLPTDLGKTPVNRRRPPPRPSESGESSRTMDEPDQIVNVRSRSRTPSEPPTKKPRDLQQSSPKHPPQNQLRGPDSPQKSQSKSSTEKIHQHQAITLSPPRPLPQLSKASDMSSSSSMPSFSSTFKEVDTIQIPPEIKAELELFDLMDELQLSGNFKPPESARSSDPTKLLNMLYTLGEGLLEYQTKKREIPMELPRDEIEEITNSISNIMQMNIIKGLQLSEEFGEPNDKSTENENEISTEVPVAS